MSSTLFTFPTMEKFPFIQLIWEQQNELRYLEYHVPLDVLLAEGHSLHLTVRQKGGVELQICQVSDLDQFCVWFLPTMLWPLVILETPEGQEGWVPSQREVQVSIRVSLATFLPSMKYFTQQRSKSIPTQRADQRSSPLSDDLGIVI